MAVQAQHPSNAFMAELRNSRARAAPVARDNRSYVASAPGVPISLAEANFQLQPNMNAVAAAAVNLFPVYASVPGLNFGQQPVLNGTVFSDPESELTCNISGSRKRAREEDILLNQSRQQISQQHLTLMSIPEFQQKNPATVPVPGSVTVTVPQSVSTGLQLAYDDSRLNQPPTSTSARNTNGATLISILGDDITAQMQQQQEEIDQIVKLHSEKIRMALEEQRQRHSRALLATMEEGILRKLKGKVAELEKLNRRNAELEEHVKHLSMESQIWQNVARNNEAMANTLRSNLEQVMAQTREQSKEGRGDSEAEDAQSCCHDEDAADAHSRTIRENKELKEQRTCRLCRINNSCILLLPCRHLCLCKDCEGSLETCPLCKSVKNASVQVYMS